VHASTRGKGKIGPIRKAIRRGKSAYYSVIFTPSFRPFRKLEEVRGKKIAWLGWSSAAGGIFPRAMLRKAGFDPDEFFAGQVVTSDHREVCSAVLEAKAEVGATFMDSPASGFVDGCGGMRGAEQGRLRVIAVSDPIPNDVLAVRADLDAGVRAALEKALDGIAATEEGREVLRLALHAEGLAPATDADFDPVRQAIKIASGIAK
jgi:phosphonate transport system substrate-binding protein